MENGWIVDYGDDDAIRELLCSLRTPMNVKLKEGTDDKDEHLAEKTGEKDMFFWFTAVFNSLAARQDFFYRAFFLHSSIFLCMHCA